MPSPPFGIAEKLASGFDARDTGHVIGTITAYVLEVSWVTCASSSRMSAPASRAAARRPGDVHGVHTIDTTCGTRRVLHGMVLTPLPTSENIADAMTERRLGAVIRRLRKQQRLTQERLAQRAGIAQPTLSQIESGVRSNPSVAIVKRLARALGVPVGELLE